MTFGGYLNKVRDEKAQLGTLDNTSRPLATSWKWLERDKHREGGTYSSYVIYSFLTFFLSLREPEYSVEAT
jgi:hypothetical protein